MKRIIDGKIYNTDTADEICTFGSSGMSSSDFKWESNILYRTKKGTFFVAGEGGPMTRWARPVGNGVSGSDGIYLVDEDEARKIAEKAGISQENYERFFGTPEEG